MNRQKILILLLAVVTLFDSCSLHRNEGRRMPSEHPRSVEYNYFFLESQRLQQKDDYAGAFDLLNYCVSIDSLAPEAYYQLGAYYADMKMDSMANACLQRAVILNPKNDAYHERLAQWHLQERKYDKAIAAYEHLYANNHNRTDVLQILMRLYQNNKDYDMMLNTINRYEQVEGASEEVTLSKMQIYSLKGDDNSAYEALRALSEEHPNDVNYKVMLGNWLQQHDRSDEARKIFMEAQNDEPNNEYVAASLYDFYRLQGEDSLSIVYRDKILLNRHTAVSTRITMMQNVIQDNETHGGDSTQVLALFKQMMQADPKNSDIANLNAAYMALKEMPEEEVNAALAHVLSIAPDDAAARLRLIQSKWRTQNWDDIIDLCLPALEYNPGEMAFCYFLGLAYYQKEDNLAALDAFRRGVSRINDKSDKDIVSDFYALMGDIQHQLGNSTEAFAAYDSCLQWKPDNMGCLNNYAYYLSEEGGDLNKAEEMSLKTVNAEPNNATFLDTYAWILYLQERYTEAKSFIDRTIENMNTENNNSILYDHAGDIYDACDDRRKAVEYWQKAVEGSDKVDVIRKKIKKYEK